MDQLLKYWSGQFSNIFSSFIPIWQIGYSWFKGKNTWLNQKLSEWAIVVMPIQQFFSYIMARTS